MYVLIASINVELLTPKKSMAAAIMNLTPLFLNTPENSKAPKTTASMKKNGIPIVNNSVVGILDRLFHYSLVLFNKAVMVASVASDTHLHLKCLKRCQVLSDQGLLFSYSLYIRVFCSVCPLKGL